MATVQLHSLDTYELLRCKTCGCRFAVLDFFAAELRNSKRTWFCPNGHQWCFPGDTEAERLQKRLTFEQTRREAAEREADTARKAEAIAKGKLKAQSERVKNGVCPCCKRTVKQLAAHMKTKHPDWSEL